MSRFSGFTLGKRKEERQPLPPPAGAAAVPSRKKTYQDEESFFNESSDDDDDQGHTYRGPTVSMETARDEIASYRSSQLGGEEEGGAGEEKEEEEDDDDPLDAFMAGIETEIKRQKVEPTKKETKAVREDIEEEDDQESYFKAMANAPIVILDDENEQDIDYDSDGNPIIPESAKVIDPLPPIDHSEIDYKPFQKNFYEEDESVQKLTKKEVQELRKKLGIKASGFSPPSPCVSFAHFGFDPQLMALIRKSEFTTPTPIQAQSIPAGLSGRDVIGVAQTGSGKTVAYLWPLLVHCIDQPEIKEGDGPIGLICAPTRELCQQIYHQARKFGKAYNLSVVCVYGGGSRYEQSLAVKEGCEVLVATPGRLIDLVKLKATNLQRVTFLVFDEADRMFDLGFEPQVRSIANHVRPDRQTLLFSATFRKKVEKLCRDILTDPVRIVIGDLGEANTDITQIVSVFKDAQTKWVWLAQHLVEFLSAGSVLVFCTKKIGSEELAHNLRQSGYQAGLLHGDMCQGDRDEVITSFKKQAFPILVATDVAARGLDISSIRTVVNYDMARDIDTHVHRIGRTGRAGTKGTAYTLVLPKDVNIAGDLVRNLETADQVVPEELLSLAMQNARFRKSRSRHGKGKGGGAGGGAGGGGGGMGRGGGGGNRRLRLGLGATNTTGNTATLGSLSSGSGPSANRAAAVKEAMQFSYKSRFQAATNTSFASTSSLQSTTPTPAPPTSDEVKPRKRKSRWD